jgi:hypothetical protein
VFLFLTMVSYGSWRFSFKSSQQVLLESFRTETSAWTLGFGGKSTMHLCHMFREKPMFWSVGTAWHYIGYSIQPVCTDLARATHANPHNILLYCQPRQVGLSAIICSYPHSRVDMFASGFL